MKSVKTIIKNPLIELGIYKNLHILFGNKKSIYSVKEIYDEFYSTYIPVNKIDLPKKKLEKLFWKWKFLYGVKPHEFFQFKLWKFKNDAECPWLFESEKIRICRSVNPQKLYDILDDKTETVRYFKDFFGRKTFFYDNKLSPEENYALFEEFYNGIKDHLVVKSSHGMGGKGVTKISLSKSAEEKEQLYKRTYDEKLLLEEVLIQHKDIAALNDSTINTLRVLTYFNQGTLKIVYALMRIGRAGSFVDNASKGGMFVPIDLSNGTICGYARKDNARIYEPERCEVHPDSKIALKGYKLPPVCEKCLYDFLLSVHNVLTSAGITKCIIGWDISIREDGTPVIIEGNGSPSASMSQIAFGKPLKETYLKMKNGTM